MVNSARIGEKSYDGTGIIDALGVRFYRTWDIQRGESGDLKDRRRTKDANAIFHRSLDR